jgi:hypothetical protein
MSSALHPTANLVARIDAGKTDKYWAFLFSDFGYRNSMFGKQTLLPSPDTNGRREIEINSMQ